MGLLQVLEGLPRSTPIAPLTAQFPAFGGAFDDLLTIDYPGLILEFDGGIILAPIND
jgi:hypothetical protein